MKSRKGSAMSSQCSRQGEPCKLRVVGYSWTQIDDNIYKRFMIRHCVVCGQREADLIHYINIDLPFCTHCGSQEFSTETISETQDILTCTLCHEKQITYTSETPNGTI